MLGIFVKARRCFVHCMNDLIWQISPALHIAAHNKQTDICHTPGPSCINKECATQLQQYAYPAVKSVLRGMGWRVYLFRENSRQRKFLRAREQKMWNLFSASENCGHVCLQMQLKQYNTHSFIPKNDENSGPQAVNQATVLFESNNFTTWAYQTQNRSTARSTDPCTVATWLLRPQFIDSFHIWMHT